VGKNIPSTLGCTDAGLEMDVHNWNADPPSYAPAFTRTHYVGPPGERL
jgi:hypothetical protein